MRLHYQTRSTALGLLLILNSPHPAGKYDMTTLWCVNNMAHKKCVFFIWMTFLGSGFMFLYSKINPLKNIYKVINEQSFFTGSQTGEIKLPKMESQTLYRNITVNLSVKIIEPPPEPWNKVSVIKDKCFLRIMWQNDLPKSQSLRMSSELMRRFSGLMSEESSREKVVNIQAAKRAAAQSSHAGKNKDISRVWALNTWC